jgi:hypothetical protein
MLPNLMPDLDQLMRALFLVALLLYFIPAVFGMGISTEGRRWFQRGAILTLGTAIAEHRQWRRPRRVQSGSRTMRDRSRGNRSAHKSSMARASIRCLAKATSLRSWRSPEIALRSCPHLRSERTQISIARRPSPSPSRRAGQKNPAGKIWGKLYTETYDSAQRT